MNLETAVFRKQRITKGLTPGSGGRENRAAPQRNHARDEIARIISRDYYNGGGLSAIVSGFSQRVKEIKR